MKNFFFKNKYIIGNKNKGENFLMEEIIIKEYLNGKSISYLIDKYPSYNRRKINKILKDNNITIRGGRRKKNLTEEQIEEIKKMIEEGAFLKEIAQHYNFDQTTMKLRLDELGLKIINKNRVNRRIKSDFFSNIDTPIKAYWLGFLFTDGSVDHYKKTGRIRLQLQEADLEILKKFKEDLQLDCKIIYDKRKNSTCCSVEFVDEQIFNDLGKYNIIPNKTYEVNHIPVEKIPEKYLNSYALGLFDGDGSLSISNDCSKNVTINYTAYHETEVQDFQKLINKLVGIEKNNKNFYTSAWHTQWRGRLQVLNILDCLYKDCPRFLKRKHDKYIILKNSLN